MVVMLFCLVVVGDTVVVGDAVVASGVVVRLAGRGGILVAAGHSSCLPGELLLNLLLDLSGLGILRKECSSFSNPKS
jgi:hypothetical protein